MMPSPKTTRLVLAMLATSACISGQADGPIAIGPYVQNVTHDSAAVCWWTVAGESKVKGPDAEHIIREYAPHELTLARLEPNTRYEYDVLGTGAPEGVGAFTTFPKEIAPFRFAAFGDTRSGHDVHQKLVDRIIEEDPLFVINTGDLVTDGRCLPDWEEFFRINRVLMRSVPYYPVLGNHEKDSHYYFDFFNLPGNERSYCYSAGDAFFLMLDSQGAEYQTPAFIKEQDLDEFWANQNKEYMDRQKEWAGRMLSLHRGAGFIFVCFHEPLISVKSSRVEDARLRRAFWDGLFERHGVQVVLNGHDHHYHHALSGGTHYITTGGGGASLYDADAPQPETIKAVKVAHYIRIDVQGDDAVLTAIDIDGQVIDEITVEKRK